MPVEARAALPSDAPESVGAPGGSEAVESVAGSGAGEAEGAGADVDGVVGVGAGAMAAPTSKGAEKACGPLVKASL
jgi:hypothetical protein